MLNLLRRLLSDGLIIGGGKSVGYGLIQFKDLRYRKIKLEDGEYRTVDEGIIEKLLGGVD